MKTTSLELHFDDTADAAYLYFGHIAHGGVARTIELQPRHGGPAYHQREASPLGAEAQNEDGFQLNIDLDQDGRVLGIEILAASRLLPSQLVG